MVIAACAYAGQSPFLVFLYRFVYFKNTLRNRLLFLKTVNPNDRPLFPVDLLLVLKCGLLNLPLNFSCFYRSNHSAHVVDFVDQCGGLAFYPVR